MKQSSEFVVSSAIWAAAFAGTLIVVGLLYLLEEMAGATVRMAWSLAVLPPAGTALAQGYRRYQAAGALTSEALTYFIAAGAITVTVLVTIARLNPGRVWPVYFIIGGAIVIYNALRQPQK
ncbi:MAG: hypothetical protein R3300_07560 [Candidatus Promineifilaceae bacterium]|nr:hypothetical protein [Candidatus Promineifilaceae bacterium]